MSKSRNQLAKELLLRENDIKCKKCLEAKDYDNRGTYYCSNWHGKVEENDYCSCYKLK